MAKDRNTVLQKYQNRVASAGPDYTAGVNNPRRDWLAAYGASQARMAAGLQAAIASGKPLKRAQAKGGTAHWQANAAKKGATNYANAAPTAAEGYANVVDKVLAAGEAARTASNNMPNTTYEQRKQRMIAAVDAIHSAWGKQ